MNELLLSEPKKMMFLVVSIYDHELGFLQMFCGVSLYVAAFCAEAFFVEAL